MTNSMQLDPRGSLWRRWDLHFHTPASFDYKDKSVTNEDIVEALRKSNVSVVAITDHHTIDVERIHKLRQLADGNVTFLPGIELRCELGGSESVHYIGIFPETIDIKELWTTLQGKLDITPSRVTAVTNEKFYVPYDRGCTAIRELGGLVSIHAGEKQNTFENISNNEPFKQLAKTEILRDHIDILEVKHEGECKGYHTKVFPKVGFRRPIIVGSDNHHIRKYSTKCVCWIRGDATFDALKHVCCEPDGRIFLGDIPPLLDRVSKNPTRYIRSIAINKAVGATISEKWFDSTIPLSHGLVAIIGNKGGGKSALADIVGLLGDSKSRDHFSFLTAKRFCKPNDNKAKSFAAEITWESNGTSQRLLSDSNAAEVESVKYLPQEYIETVCNELETHGGGRFSKELTSVIFSHVDRSDRLKWSTFDELLEYKTSEKKKSLYAQRESLRKLIATLVALENQSSTSHIREITEKLAAKNRELTAHIAAKPTEVAKPDDDDDATRTAAQTANQTIAELTTKTETLRKQLDDKSRLLTEANRRITAAARLLTRLKTFESEIDSLRQESADDCSDLGIPIESIVSITLNLEGIIEAKRVASEQTEELNRFVNQREPESIPQQIATIETELTRIRSELEGPSKKYQEYLKALKEWEVRGIAITGSPGEIDTVKFFEQQLKDSNSAASEVPKALEDVIKKSLDIYDQVSELADAYQELYAPVQRFIQEHPLAKTQFQMSFETKLVEQGFTETFLSMIAQNRRGSFSGSLEGRERINRLCHETNFNLRNSAEIFLRNLWNALHSDVRHDPAVPQQVMEQLAKGYTLQAIYEAIFGFEYLNPFFTLRWAGKDVQQLSPGERGTLLLVFYLLIDRSDIPLIIDQPEENLDNHTVYNVLVPSIKEARERRQIIIVTHNPNLAVVCDADQVICASINKEDGNKVTYEMGAIENPTINRRILDILEGTRPAFENRNSKYHSPSE